MVFGGLLFLFRNFWPWWKDVYWPARHARDREQYDQLVNLNDRLLSGLEQKMQVMFQGLSNMADGISHIQDQVRRQETNDDKLLELAQDSLSNIEGLSVVIVKVEEGYEISSRKLERFEEILTRIGVAYLSDKIKKEKANGPRIMDNSLDGNR